MNRLTLALLAATLALAPSATHAATAIWIGPENGNWSDPANWSTGAVPIDGDYAYIDGNTTSSSYVTADVGTKVLFLQLDPNDRLIAAHPGFGFFSSHLAGTLAINAGISVSANGLMHVEPTGQIVLSENAGAELVASTGGGQLWRNQGEIRGSGVLRPQGTFLNEGMLSADVPEATLDIIASTAANSTVLTNTGLAQATEGGILRFAYSGERGSAIQQPGNTGRIQAAPFSKVSLHRVTLEGGTLAALTDATGAGIVEAIDTSFGTIRFEGTINATRARLAGSISNTGKFQALQSLGLTRGLIELSGGGVLQLDSPSTSADLVTLNITNLSSIEPAILRNVDNTINGRGRISLLSGKLDNRGIIEAGFGEDDSAAPSALRVLSLEQGAITNTGSIRSQRDYLLGIYNTQVLNSDSDNRGMIEALPGGAVELLGVTIVGGVLRGTAAMEGSELPDGIVRFVGSQVRLSNLQLEGTIGTNSDIGIMDGRIEIDGRLQLRDLYLTSSTEFVGGEILLAAGGGQLRLATEIPSTTPATLTLTDSTLRVGSVTAIAPSLQIANRGAIIASANATTRLSTNNPILNAGLIHAESGAHLSTLAIETVPGSTAAEVRLDANATITATQLVGGRVVASSGTGGEPHSGALILDGSSSLTTLQDVVNEGLIMIQRGTFAGIIENNGVVEIASGRNISQASHLVRLEGNGQLRLLGATIQRSIIGSGSTLINGEEHTIRTRGTIDYQSGTFINEGTVQADTGTIDIRQSNGHFLQQGTLRTIGASTLNLHLTQLLLNNDGIFDINPQGTISITGPAQIVNRAASEMRVEGTLKTSFTNLVNNQGATIHGGGIIEGDSLRSMVTNEGLISPGSPIGALRIRTNFTQSAMGKLQIDVAGFESGQFDQLVIEANVPTYGGDATLAGTLDFNFAPELIPALGDELIVLTAKQITGVFDTIEGLPTLATGLEWQIDYLPTMVMATVIGLTPPNLAGDFNGDGFVNLADYTVWRDGLGDTYAASDYDLWKQNFGRSANAPVPEATTPASVPEPTAVLLALAFLPLLARRAKP